MIKNILILISFLNMLACQETDATSDLKVTNGIRSQPDAFKAIIPQDGCTGTFVSPTTIITSGQCADHGFTYKGVGTTIFKSMAEHTGKPQAFDLDVRVMVFPKAMSDIWIPVKDTPLKKGDKVVIAGYGLSDTNLRPFRYGTNIVKSFEANGRLSHIFGVFDESVVGKEGLESLYGAGDGGGPLLHEGQLAATFSGSAGNKAFQLNLTDPDVRTFLNDMVKEGAVINFGGKGSIDYEECFDVSAEEAETTVTFKQPHSRISKVSGTWSTCVCDECPETDANGYTSGPYKGYNPVYKDINSGALLLWGKRIGKEADTTFDKAGYVKDNLFQFKQNVFGAKMSMHAKADSKRSGKLKVCFL